MYDYSKLLGRIKEKGLTQEALANKIGISGTTLSKKLNNIGKFSQAEMLSICEVLDIPVSDIASYFFAKQLVKNTSVEEVKN